VRPNIASLISGYGAPNIVCDAAQFDGANDWLSKASNLSGVSDGTTGILSCWIRIDGGDSTAQTVIRGATVLDSTVGFLWNRHSGNGFNLIGWDNVGNFPLADTNSAPNNFSTSASWVHFLASWKVSVTTAHLLFINDANRYADGGNTGPGTIQYTGAGAWTIGADVGGARKCNMAIAELYFAPNQFLDFSLVANRRRFRSAGGKPVHLGTTGALPTGTAPAIYLHLDDGETANNFATNRGTGGNFSVNGALTTATSSPSD